MTQIIHWSQRNQRLIDAGRLDGSAAWSQSFDGTPAEAESHIRESYGRAGRVDKASDSTRFCFVGFTLTVIH